MFCGVWAVAEVAKCVPFLSWSLPVEEQLLVYVVHILLVLVFFGLQCLGEVLASVDPPLLARVRNMVHVECMWCVSMHYVHQCCLVMLVMMHLLRGICFGLVGPRLFLVGSLV